MDKQQTPCQLGLISQRIVFIDIIFRSRRAGQRNIGHDAFSLWDLAAFLQHSPHRCHRAAKGSVLPCEYEGRSWIDAILGLIMQNCSVILRKTGQVVDFQLSTYGMVLAALVVAVRLNLKSRMTDRP